MRKSERLHRAVNTLALLNRLNKRQATFRAVRAIGVPWGALTSKDVDLIEAWVKRGAPPSDTDMRRLRNAARAELYKGKRKIKSHPQGRPQKTDQTLNIPPPLECNIVFEGPDGSVRELSSGPRREPIPPGGNGKVRLVPGRGKYRRSVLKKKG